MTAPHEPTDETLDAMHACTIGDTPSRDQWRAVYRVAVEAYDAELRRVLGARDDESTADAARRAVTERDEALRDMCKAGEALGYVAASVGCDELDMSDLDAAQDTIAARADALRRERDEAHHTVKNMATEANARRVEVDSLRHERDEARAEVERLRSGAGVCATNRRPCDENQRALVAAQRRIDDLTREVRALESALRLAESTRDAAQAIATRETERRREVEARLNDESASLDACRSEAIDAIRGEMAARAEADALRELAWSWCISAVNMRDAPRSVLDSRPKMPTPEHEPIESLGPVPILPNGLATLCNGPECLLDQVVGWLIRDAVRRGAKLEGE